MAWNKRYVLAVTGGIGAGKSLVSSMLRKQGIPVYDTDSAAKRLMTESHIIKQTLVNIVGEQVYVADGTLNRSLLAEWLFASADHVALMNNIVHPVVKRDFQQWCEEQSCPLVGMECAILFESGFNELADGVIVVHASDEVRLQRVLLRDGATEQQVRARMAAQMSEQDRMARADYVVVNEGGESDVERQILQILRDIRQSATSD